MSSKNQPASIIYRHVIFKRADGTSLFPIDGSRHLLAQSLPSHLIDLGISLHGFCFTLRFGHLLLTGNESDVDAMLARVGKDILDAEAPHIVVPSARGSAVVWASGICRGTEKALLTLARMHTYPLRGGIVDKLEDFFWSSHLNYAGSVNRDWVETETLLAAFGPKFSSTSRMLYRKFIGKYLASLSSDEALGEIRKTSNRMPPS